MHSIKDDIYQIQSIIKTCNSKKLVEHCFDNKSTQEFLQSADCRIILSDKLYENCPNLQLSLQVYYNHRLLVNHAVMWPSLSYVWDVMKLLDNHFEQLTNQINGLKPTSVPEE